MKCPACCKELAEVQVGSWLVDVCQGGCGGIWFDAFVLQRMDKADEPGEPLLDIQRDESLVLDPSPQTGVPSLLGGETPPPLLLAPNAAYRWTNARTALAHRLDAGELAQIWAERSDTGKTQKPASPASPTSLSVMHRGNRREILLAI